MRTAATHPTRLQNKSGQRADEASCMVNSHLAQRNVLGYDDTVFLVGGYPRLKLTGSGRMVSPMESTAGLLV